MLRRRNIIPNGLRILAVFALLSAAAWAKHEPNPQQPSAEEIAKITKAAPSKAPAKPAQERKLLVFWRCEGFFHKAIPYGNEAFRALGEKTKAYTTVVSDDMAVLNSSYLAQFDALLLNSTTRLVLDENQRRAILDFVKGGKGIVGIHGATDNFYDWPEGAEMMGGLFDGHPWAAKGTWAVQIDESGHPIAKSFGGKGFLVTDELYQIRDYYSRDKLRVLASLDMTNERNLQVDTSKIKRKDSDFGLAWIREYGQGRVFYSAFGHNNDLYWDKAILGHFLAGIQYALGDLQADATPSAKLESKPTPARTTGLGAVDSDYVALRRYSYAQNNKILYRIESEIREASPKQLEEIEESLLESLQAPESTYACKEFICRMLRVMGTKRSVPALARLLEDKELSHMARYALQAMPSSAAAGALRKSLGKLEGDLLVGAIGSVGARKDRWAVSKLRKLAENTDQKVAGAAILALGRIGSSSAEKALAKAKTPAALENTRASARLMCADALLADGKESRAADIYRELAGGGNATVTRLAAYRGVIRADAKSAVPTVLALLKSLDPDLRALGGKLIAEIPCSDTRKTIAQDIPILKPDAQVLVLEALAAHGDKSVQAEVAKVAASGPDEVRVAAARALATVGDASSAEMLSEMTVARGPVGEAALESLALLSGEGVSAALANVAKNHGDPAVRANVVKTLGVRGDPAGAPAALAATRDQDPEVRQAAYKTLGNVAGEDVLPAMVDLLLEDRPSSERDALGEAVASAAGRIGDKERAVSAVLAGLSKSENQAKPGLLAVLSRLGGEKALQAVRKELAGGDGEVRKAAVRALAAWSDASPMEDLKTLAEKDADPACRVLALQGYIRQVALDAKRPAKETAQLLGGAMKLASRAEEKRSVLSALSDSPCAESLETAKASLKDKEVADEAGQAVSKIKRSLLKKSLKATASERTEDCPKAFDDDPDSRWSTSGNMAPGDWFALDLGEKVAIRQIVLSVNQQQNAPKECEVYVSQDGKEWGEAIGKAKGDKKTKLVFPAGTVARHVKIVQTGAEKQEWRICDLDVELVD